MDRSKGPAGKIITRFILAAGCWMGLVSRLQAQEEPKPQLIKDVSNSACGTPSYLCMTGDAKIVAVCCSDGSVVSWDVKTEEIHKHPSQVRRCFALAISSDGKWLASGGAFDGLVHLSSLADGKLVKTFQPFEADENQITGMAFSPDGSVLFIDREMLPGNYQLKGFRRNGFAQVTELIIPWRDRVGKARYGNECGTGSLCFSGDGKRLACAASLQGVVVWDAKSFKELAAFHMAPEGPDVESYKHLYGVALNPSGKLLSACGAKGQLFLWDVAANKESRQFKQTETSDFYSLSFHPTKDLLYVAGIPGVICLDLKTGEERWRIKEPKGAFIALNKDGTILAASHTAGFSLYGLSPSVSTPEKK